MKMTRRKSWIQKTAIVFRTVAVIVVIVLIAALLTACTSGDNDNHSDERGNMNIDFGEDGMIRNGTEYYTYRVETGYRGVVSINIAKQSGSIDIDIYPVDGKDEPAYTGRDLDSTSFAVILDEPGEYKVCIKAKEYIGDYGVSWKTEGATEK